MSCGRHRIYDWTRILIVAASLSIFDTSLVRAQTPDADELGTEVARLYQAGKYSDAIPLAERALASDEKRLGPDDPRVGTRLNDLALLYAALGRYAEAEPLYKRALAIGEKTVGVEHPDVGTRLNNLAMLYYAQGRYASAEPLYQRSLTIAEKSLGPNDPVVASRLNNLAALFQAQGRSTEAEPIYLRAVAIAQKALGPDHPDVGLDLNNLAELYRTQGRYVEAEPLYKRSLSIAEKAFGPDNLDVGRRLNNLALLYSAQGRYAEAEPLLKRSLAIVEKVVGPDHIQVATVLNNLAETYRSQARFEEAEPLFKRALAIAEKTLGPDHPEVGTYLNNLALLFAAEGRYAEQEPLLKRALSITEKALGPNHPAVGTDLNNLSALYYKQGRYKEAEPLLKRALAIAEASLGPDHPEVGTRLNNLAELYSTQGRYAEAEPIFQRALAIAEKALGPDHPDVGTRLENLAALYDAEGRHSEAQRYKRRAEAIPGWDVADEHILFATNRGRVADKSSGSRFGDEQALDPDKIILGRATLRVPKTEVLNRAERGAQALGQLDKALGRQTNEATLSLARIDVAEHGAKVLFAEAHGQLTHAALFPNQAIIYVHGYNNSFEDAVRRTALIAYDLDFDGLPIAFAWPSRSGITAYVGDRDRAEAAVPFLLRTLELIGAEFPTVKVHIIAHSTGAEVVLGALERLVDRSANGQPPVQIGEVIFAHADVTPSRLATVMQSLRPLGIHVTSYSSSEDWAMRTSDWIRWDGTRVGGAPVHIDGVDAIDISGLGARLSLNHNVFVQNPMVFGDMARLIATGERPPQKRTPSFVEVRTDQGVHWQFQAPK